jgi:hypothetical protein
VCVLTTADGRSVCQSVSRSGLFKKSLRKFSLVLNAFRLFVFNVLTCILWFSQPSSDVYSAGDTPMVLLVKKKERIGFKTRQRGTAPFSQSRWLAIFAFLLPTADMQIKEKGSEPSATLLPSHVPFVILSVPVFFSLCFHSWTILDAGACIFAVVHYC